MEISSGAALLGSTALNIGASLFGSSKSSNKETARRNDQAWKHARDQFEQQLQYRVKDARKAGIHPLFGLGAQTGGGSPIFRTGQHDSGSGLGTAARAVGSGLGQYASLKSGRALQAAQIRNLEADTYRNYAEAQAAQSRAKTLEHRANIVQAATPHPLGETGDITKYPLDDRALRIEPNVSAPAYDEVVLPDGTVLQVISHKYDEVAQADLLLQLAKVKAQRWAQGKADERHKALSRETALRALRRARTRNKLNRRSEQHQSWRKRMARAARGGR